MRIAGSEAASVAKQTLSLIGILAGAAALAAAVSVVPADAKKSKTPDSEQASVDKNQPMTIIVSLRNQKANIYRGTTLITSTRVSTGKRGYSTKPGVYSILEKRRRHFSNLYGGAPMPYMQRLTWTGTALHAGVVPGYPASHGCIRLPHGFAPKLFGMTGVGEQVVIARSMVEPKVLEHPALFQPLPPPLPPVVAKDSEPQEMRRSSNDAAPSTRLPVVFAKAEAVTPQAATPAEAKFVAPTHAEARREPMRLAVLEDTRTHAIDPGAAPFMGSGSHGLAVKPSSEETETTVRTSDDFMKHQDRLAEPEETGRETAEAPTVEEPTAEEPSAISVSASAAEQPEATEPANAEIALASPAVLDEPAPQAGPSVTAAAVTPPAAKFASVEIRPFTPSDHPPLPLIKPSVITAKLLAGAAAAATEAAEPRSTEPLRVLITRRTKQDRMIDVQYTLASMGHLEGENFDGTFGRKTVAAIKSFQKANDLPETGAFTDDLVKKVYAVAGKSEPPTGHLFVRQKFASVFDTPVRFRNPDAPLGTHVFTVQHFEKDATEAKWTAISLKPDADPTTVLDRIEIPDDVRQNISERLTPGSSLIVADTAINSATLPKGADFLVWDTSKPATVERASVSPKPRRKRRVTTRRTQPSYARRRAPTRYQRGPWPF